MNQELKQKMLICTSADICTIDCLHKTKHELLDMGCEVTEWCKDVRRDTACIEVKDENK